MVCSVFVWLQCVLNISTQVFLFMFDLNSDLFLKSPKVHSLENTFGRLNLGSAQIVDCGADSSESLLIVLVKNVTVNVSAFSVIFGLIHFCTNYSIRFIYSFVEPVSILVFVLGWKVKLVTCRIRPFSNQCHSKMIVIILIPNKNINPIKSGNIRMIRQLNHPIILVDRSQKSRGIRRTNGSEFCIVSQIGEFFFSFLICQLHYSRE